MAYGDHVQSRGVDSGASVNPTLAYSGNVVAGNILVAGARIGVGALYTGFTDSQGNTWTTVENFTDLNSLTHVTAWAIAGSSAANTVTMNNAGGSQRWIIGEYDSAGQTISLDQHTHATGNGSTLDSGSVTTTVATELIVGFAHDNNAFTLTPGGTYTERQEVSTRISLEDKTVSSTGSYSTDWTIASSDNWAASIMTLSGTGGGGGGGATYSGCDGTGCF